MKSNLQKLVRVMTDSAKEVQSSSDLAPLAVIANKMGVPAHSPCNHIYVRAR